MRKKTAVLLGAIVVGFMVLQLVWMDLASDPTMWLYDHSNVPGLVIALVFVVVVVYLIVRSERDDNQS